MKPCDFTLNQLNTSMWGQSPLNLTPSNFPSRYLPIESIVLRSTNEKLTAASSGGFVCPSVPPGVRREVPTAHSDSTNSHRACPVPLSVK